MARDFFAWKWAGVVLSWIIYFFIKLLHFYIYYCDGYYIMLLDITIISKKR